MGTIDIREGGAIPEKQAKELSAALGWGHLDQFLPRLLLNSTFVVSAWDEAKLVGLSRVVSDGVYASMLHQVGVHPDYQRTGLGSELVRRCLEKFAHTNFVLTIDDPTQAGFYRRFGFEPVGSGMVRPREG